MASWIADRMTQMLITSSLIEEGDRELYNYGFFMLISRIYFFLVTIVTGLLMDIPSESILFYVVFMVLRTYAGGVHAKTENMCSVLTTLALTASIVGIKQLESIESELISLLMLGTGSLCILLFSPLDTKEKPLDEQEKRKYRPICIITVLLCYLFVIVAQILFLSSVLEAVACSIFLESILLVCGKIATIVNTTF